MSISIIDICMVKIEVISNPIKDFISKNAIISRPYLYISISIRKIEVILTQLKIVYLDDNDYVHILSIIIKIKLIWLRIFYLDEKISNSKRSECSRQINCNSVVIEIESRFIIDMTISIRVFTFLSCKSVTRWWWVNALRNEWTENVVFGLAWYLIMHRVYLDFLIG